MNALGALEATGRRLDALYDVDARGRIAQVAARTAAERAPGAAPRFHLARTSLGNVWRLRYDLSTPLVKRLAALVGKEPAIADTEGLEEPEAPEREEFLRRALKEFAPIESFWSGPGYAFPESLVPQPHANEVRGLTAEDAESLHPELADAVLTPGTQGVFVEERIVSLCICARRGPGEATEAGVRTAEEFRRRGHAEAAVRAWALGVIAQGGEPFYSTSWDNLASRGLARKLGLVFIAEDRHWR